MIAKASDGDVTITKAGLAYLGSDVPPTPQTTEELLTLWRGVLRQGERRMLDVLVAAYPQAISREALGEQAGYTASGGTFGPTSARYDAMGRSRSWAMGYGRVSGCFSSNSEN